MAGCAFGFLTDKQITKKSNTSNPVYRNFLYCHRLILQAGFEQSEPAFVFPFDSAQGPGLVHLQKKQIQKNTTKWLYVFLSSCLIIFLPNIFQNTIRLVHIFYIFERDGAAIILLLQFAFAGMISHVLQHFSKSFGLIIVGLDIGNQKGD